MADVYNEVYQAAVAIQDQRDQRTTDGLHSLNEVLREGELQSPQSSSSGPDYLLDIAILECVIWQAEVIDPTFGADLKRRLQACVQNQADLQG